MSTPQAKIAANIAALKEKMGTTQIGGKGSVRHAKKAAPAKAATSDKALALQLKKLGANPIPGIESVAFVKNDGTAIEFDAPKVQASINSNMWAVSGASAVRPYAGGVGPAALQQMLSGMGPAELAMLQKALASGKMDPAQLTSLLGAAGAGGAAGDDDMPELEGDFESAATA